MKILFMSDLKGKVSSGMSWSVPARIAAQARIDDVLWVNLTEVSMPHWEATGVYHTIGEYGSCKMEVLPDSFSKPDLVVFEGVYYIKFVKLAKELRKKNIPYIIVPRSMLTRDAIHNGKFLKKTVANFLFFNKFVRKALAIQYLTAKEYHDSGDGWNKRYIISPNGFDAPETLNRTEGDGSIRCTFIGRLDIYQKGLDLLVQACTNIQDILRNARFRITLYGPDWHGSIDTLNKQIKDNGLSDLIMLGGEIKGEAKAECLFASDLFIMTSRFEGMPMGLIEALAYGVPALLTPGTNMCDRIDRYDAGWTCGESVEYISKGLQKVIEQKSQLEEKGRHARELALKYNWNKIAEEFKHDVKQQLKDKENMNKVLLMSLAKMGGGNS